MADRIDAFLAAMAPFDHDELTHLLDDTCRIALMAPGDFLGLAPPVSGADASEGMPMLEIDILHGVGVVRVFDGQDNVLDLVDQGVGTIPVLIFWNGPSAQIETLAKIRDVDVTGLVLIKPSEALRWIGGA